MKIIIIIIALQILVIAFMVVVDFKKTWNFETFA